MAWSIDSRIPVTFMPDMAALDAALAAGPATAILVEAPAPPGPTTATAIAEFVPVAPHVAGCACCGGRSPAAVALDRLFQARMRGKCGWFERVVVLAPTPAGRAAVRAALDADALTAARFRQAGG